MSSTFIIGMPVALGFLTMVLHRHDEKLRLRHYFGLPCASATLALVCALLFMLEGLICVILWLPLFWILSCGGGLLAYGVLALIKRRRNRMYCAAVVALLPFATAPLESLKQTAGEIRTVPSTIIIDAPADVVWRHIASVDPITEAEHRFSWVHTIGFPRPIEAKLIGEGVGAVRHATFEGDVLFIETITEWQENRRISFSIDANADTIPAETFDEHVTIGGPYFDVLSGTYVIEPLAENRVKLHLSSDQRLSTNFNFYSRLWTVWLMQSIQDYILEVVKARCEAER